MLSFFRRKKPPARGAPAPAETSTPLPADGPDAGRGQVDAIDESLGIVEPVGATEPVPSEVIAAALDVEPGLEAPSLSYAQSVEPGLDAPLPVPAVATPDPARADAAPAAAGKPGWRERLRSTAFARSLGGLFSRNPKLDDDLLDEIETALLTADVGVTATTQLVEGLRKRMKAREFADANALLASLRAELVAMLRPVAIPLQIDTAAKPFVLLTVGVNGVGKTTTIGKLAKRFKDEGRPLMLAAGDTFRASRCEVEGDDDPGTVHWERTVPKRD